jgi:hypothetical protein
MKYTPDQLQRIYTVARNAQWRYKLDGYEDDALKTILSTLGRATDEIEERIVSKSLTDFQGDRLEAMMVELDGLTAGARLQLASDIKDVSGYAGEWAATEHASITSFGGLVAKFNNISLTAEQFKEFFGGTPLGGKSLAGWVDAAFDSTVKEGLRETINSGVLQGEGYRQLARRALSDSFGLLKHEAITLTRTYVQSANVAAQQAVYAANADIVKKWEWCATLESGYQQTGRGTCIRCAALDGQQFELGKGPDCPLHPRCRCIALPVTASWRDLGINADDLKEAARPYTKRPDKSIDAGGRRDIIEHGFHDSDYGTWFAKQSNVFQENAVGPRRAAMLRAGKVKFHDLVDGQGRLRTLANLGWEEFHKSIGRIDAGSLGIRGQATLAKAIKNAFDDIALRGVNSVEYVDESYFMATNSHGKILLSTREFPTFDNFCPAKDLQEALRRLGAGEPLTFNQEYAVESLWHEVNHNRQVLGVRPGKGNVRHALMETVNQWVSRRSYQEAFDALGGYVPQRQAQVIASGYGYGDLLKRMGRLTETLGIKDSAIFDDVYEMLKTVKRFDYMDPLSNILARASGKDMSEVTRVLEVLNDEALFEKRLGRLK